MHDPSRLQRFERDGFLVLPGFRDPAAVAEACAQAWRLIEAFDPQAHRSTFATDDQARRHADQRFFDSAEAVSCFFEVEALDADGRLRVPKSQAINKIGHALHELDPVFERFSHGADLAALAAELGLQAPQVWQSMLIVKPPGIGGEVKWHQDATFLGSTPETVTGFWFALEDADRHNGCLWVQPGGHRGPLRERFARLPGGGVAMQALDGTAWPVAGEPGTQPVEVPAGSLVVLHGLLPHWSAPNRSERSRLAYALHATDGRARYHADNWLQRSRLPLRGFEG